MIARNARTCAVARFDQRHRRRTPPRRSSRLSSADFAPGGTLGDEHAYNGMGCRDGNVSRQFTGRARLRARKATHCCCTIPMRRRRARDGGTGSCMTYRRGTTALRRARAIPTDRRCRRAPKSVPTDYGIPGYGGPARPRATSRTATSSRSTHSRSRSSTAEGGPAPVAGFIVNANAIGKTSLTGMYGRAKR